jgi:acetyltransferase-like isoleucine patch superfamily enzyme
MRFVSGGPPRAVQVLARAFFGAAIAGRRARRFLYGSATVRRFGSHGDDFVFDPDGTYTYGSIHVGRNVDLGLRPTILATLGEVRIGDNVMFGPDVTIRGGNHRIDVVGMPMIAVAKEPGDDRFDRGVTIEDDVWVGTRAVILHGVTIGRGAVIGAGAVVTRSVPPYAVVAGVPARVLRLRWSVDVIAEHERSVYAPDHRLTADQLSRLAAAPALAQDGTMKPATAGHAR